jgi:DNA-binding protein Fis
MNYFRHLCSKKVMGVKDVSQEEVDDPITEAILEKYPWLSD